MNWHEDILNVSVRRALKRIVPIAASRFYLGGGTGLALRLGHRISLDLDFFSSENALEEKQRFSILDALKTSGSVEIHENRDGTCRFLVERTSISLFHYSYPLLLPVSNWRGVRVASMEDIAAMKVSAIIGRGARKDFVDLYAVCRRTGLESILKFAAKKYRDHSSFIIQAAKALVYFEDALEEPMPRMRKNVSWNAVRTYFESEVKRIVRKKIF